MATIRFYGLFTTLVLMAVNVAAWPSTDYYIPQGSGGVNYTRYDLYRSGVRLANTFSLVFNLYCSNDVHILLQESASDYENNVIEIVLGGWGNTKSVIRDEQQGTPVAENNESNIISGSERRYFWLSWDSGTIAVGKGDTPYTNEVMSWNGLDHDVNYICIGIGNETDAHWKFKIIDGGWSDWSEWDTCTTTCGAGSMTRTRTCNNPPVSSRGAQCEGDSEETIIDGEWGAWSMMSCSAACGYGTLVKTRLCDSPAPANGGNNCTGSSNETDDCIDQYCQPNGNTTYANQCGSGMFTCSNGTMTCIDEAFRCDCERDCDDSSDEDVTWAGCNKTFETRCSSAGKLWWNMPVVMMVILAHILFSKDN